MHQLEARKATLKAEIEAGAGADEMPVLHPGLSELYRRKMSELTEALLDEGRSAEAAEAIRAPLQEIRLVPEEIGWRSSWSARWPGCSVSRTRNAPATWSPGRGN